ncbi:hypothetical protein GIB67_024441, partial [Kingdonia uniflora]
KMVDSRWVPVVEKRGRACPSTAVEKLWRFGRSALGGRAFPTAIRRAGTRFPNNVILHFIYMPWVRTGYPYVPTYGNIWESKIGISDIPYLKLDITVELSSCFFGLIYFFGLELLLLSLTCLGGFTMPPKNKKAQQEVTGDLSQDTFKQAEKFNETRMFHLPPEEWDVLIKINENISTFRKGGLPYENLLEAIFVNRVATGQYVIGPGRDNFIYTATSDVAADFNIEDENDVP